MHVLRVISLHGANLFCLEALVDSVPWCSEESIDKVGIFEGIVNTRVVLNFSNKLASLGVVSELEQWLLNAFSLLLLFLTSLVARALIIGRFDLQVVAYHTQLTHLNGVEVTSQWDLVAGDLYLSVGTIGGRVQISTLNVSAGGRSDLLFIRGLLFFASCEIRYVPVQVRSLLLIERGSIWVGRIFKQPGGESVYVDTLLVQPAHLYDVQVDDLHAARGDTLHLLVLVEDDVPNVGAHDLLIDFE